MAHAKTNDILSPQLTLADDTKNFETGDISNGDDLRYCGRSPSVLLMSVRSWRISESMKQAWGLILRMFEINCGVIKFQIVLVTPNLLYIKTSTQGLAYETVGMVDVRTSRHRTRTQL